MFKAGYGVASGTKEAPAGRSKFTASHTMRFFFKGNKKKNKHENLNVLSPLLFLVQMIQCCSVSNGNIKYLEG